MCAEVIMCISKGGGVLAAGLNGGVVGGEERGRERESLGGNANLFLQDSSEDVAEAETPFFPPSLPPPLPACPR